MLTPAKKFAKYLTVLSLTGILNIASADVLVLIHGYMGSPDSWEKTGINNLLENYGWQRGGLILPDTH